jgi:hypothetical protein
VCRISEGLAALAIGVGSLVPAVLHRRREDPAKEAVPVMGNQDPMDRHTPEVSLVASHTAGMSAEAGGTCSIRAALRSPCEP